MSSLLILSFVFIFVFIFIRVFNIFLNSPNLSQSTTDSTNSIIIESDDLLLAMSYFKYTKLPTLKELSKDYKRLAKKFHPDTGGSSEDFKTLQKHYKVLKDNIQK